jgi:hypothetical protein
MEVTMTGWRKNHGPRRLFAGKFTPSTGGATFSLGQSVATPHLDRHWGCRQDVSIEFGAANVALNGDYCGCVTLSDVEVARLFFLVVRGKTFEQVQELLSSSAHITSGVAK